MNQWSLHRKHMILLGIVVILIILLGIPLFFFLQKAPTCSDGIQNGDEKGIDCGGSCKIECRAGLLPMILKGDPRVLQIASSTFEVIADVENPNPSAEVMRGTYTLNIYEANNPVPLKTIQSSTFIPKASRFIIFQGPFDFASSTPVRATFGWNTDTLVWVPDTNPLPQVDLQNSVFSNASTTARLQTTVSNQTEAVISNIELVALIMDQNANIIGASKTFIDSLAPNASAPSVFTWGEPFTASSTSFTIIPRILPDRSYLQ